MITHDITEALSLGTTVITLNKRPTSIKNIYKINFLENKILDKRKNKKFNELYEKIWKDLNEHV